MNVAEKLRMLDAMDVVPFDPTVDIPAMFDNVLGQIAEAEQLVFVGGPRSGKSTLTATAAERFKRKARHADALIARYDWSEHSEEVSKWLAEPGPWIVEGVSTARALRKWLTANPDVPAPFTKIGRASCRERV